MPSLSELIPIKRWMKMTSIVVSQAQLELWQALSDTEVDLRDIVNIDSTDFQGITEWLLTLPIYYGIRC